MSSTWLPGWPALSITAALAVAVALQLQHLSALAGRHAAWHAGHVLMGLGMIAMYLPTPSMLVPAAAGTAVFAAATVLTAGVLAFWAVRRRGGGLLWLLLADFAWMPVMYRTMAQPVRWLSVVGAVWFAVTAVGWAIDLFGRLLRDGPPSGIPEGEPRHRYLRASLTVMALAMGYMSLAMAVGSPAAGMPGLSHTGH